MLDVFWCPVWGIFCVTLIFMQNQCYYKMHCVNLIVSHPSKCPARPGWRRGRCRRWSNHDLLKQAMEPTVQVLLPHVANLLQGAVWRLCGLREPPWEKLNHILHCTVFSLTKIWNTNIIVCVYHLYSKILVRGRSHIMSATEGGGVSQFLIISDKGKRGS